MPRGRAQVRHPRMFSCPFVSIRGSNQYLDYIRVHSCPFVVHPLPPPSRLSCFSWFKHCLDYVFLHIRVHSCPFVVLPLPPPSCFSWFKHCLDHVFLHIRVHSWFSLFPLLRVFSCISCFSWFKHCLDYVFVHSCPFVSIRGSPSSPSFVFFRGLILPFPFSLLVQFFLFSRKQGFSAFCT